MGGRRRLISICPCEPCRGHHPTQISSCVFRLASTFLGTTGRIPRFIDQMAALKGLAFLPPAESAGTNRISCLSAPLPAVIRSLQPLAETKRQRQRLACLPFDAVSLLPGDRRKQGQVVARAANPSWARLCCISTSLQNCPPWALLKSSSRPCLSQCDIAAVNVFLLLLLLLDKSPASELPLPGP